MNSMRGVVASVTNNSRGKNWTVPFACARRTAICHDVADAAERPPFVTCPLLDYFVKICTCH